MLLEQHLTPIMPNQPILGPTNTHTFDLLFCRTMVSLRLSARQSDIFKDFTYLCLTWIKPFSVRFAEGSTNFERMDNLPMVLFSYVFNSKSGWEWLQFLNAKKFIWSLGFWLAVTYHHAHGKEATCLRLFRKN